MKSRFVVLTGLSGSGKSQAIRALEDLGYFCVDNLPVTLLPMFADLTLRAGSEISRAAVVVDVREGRLLADFPAIYAKLKARKNSWSGHSYQRGRRCACGFRRRAHIAGDSVSDTISEITVAPAMVSANWR